MGNWFLWYCTALNIRYMFNMDMVSVKICYKKTEKSEFFPICTVSYEIIEKSE